MKLGKLRCAPCALIVVLAFALLAQEKKDGRKTDTGSAANAEEKAAPPPETEAQAIEKSEWMMQHYDQIGNYWVKVLDDEKRPNHRRVWALKVLAKMKYRPAIPFVIKHIRLVDKSVQVISGNEDEPMIAVTSLAQFGNTPIPQLIDAYLVETDRTTRNCLRWSIVEAGTQKSAMTYMLGLQAQNNKLVTDERAQEFLRRLK